MGIFSSISKAVKSVTGIVKKAAPVLGTVSSFIPGVGGTLGSIGSSLLGSIGANAPSMAAGAMQAYGSAQQQKLAIEEAQRQRDWSAGQAQIARKWNRQSAWQQMGFQRKMSSTAHRRQMKDLRLAGLNPILAATGGASSPGGAMGTAPMPSGTTAQVIDQIGPAVHSAMQMKGLQNTLKTAETQRALMKEQENSAHAQGVIDLQRMHERTVVDKEKAQIRDIEAQAKQRELDHARGRAEHEFYNTLGPAAKFAALAGGGAATAVGIKKLFESNRTENPRNGRRRRR